MYYFYSNNYLGVNKDTNYIVFNLTDKYSNYFVYFNIYIYFYCDKVLYYYLF